jgi:hypothetical protein
MRSCHHCYTTPLLLKQKSDNGNRRARREQVIHCDIEGVRHGSPKDLDNPDN